MEKVNIGRHPWNYGLTKETDERIVKYAKNLSLSMTKNPKPEAKLCECGCNEYANPGKRFIKGHHLKNKPMSIENRVKHSIARGGTGEIKEKISVLCHCNCGEMTKPGSIFISGHNSKTEKAKKEQSEKMKGGTPWNKGKVDVYSEETLLAMKKARAEQEPPRLNVPFSEESKKLISKKTREYNDNHPEKREQHSLLMLKKWQDLEYQKNQNTGRAIMPNKPETIILNLLGNICPEEWTYTGDFSFWVNGKCPDFKHNTQKKLIELFGDYWHKGEDPFDRKSIFREKGWKTLVLWEHELKDMNKIKDRICEFTKE